MSGLHLSAIYSADNTWEEYLKSVTALSPGLDDCSEAPPARSLDHVLIPGRRA
jgi:hypothetical protein